MDSFKRTDPAQPERRASTGQIGRVGLYLFVLLTGLFVARGLTRTEDVCPEARIRDSICLRLAANTTEGRQALISSVWWGPLPTLARLPFVFAAGAASLPVASILVSAVFGAASIVLLLRIMSWWGVGPPARFTLAAGLALNPHFLSECHSGSSVTGVAFLVLLTVHGVVLWLTERRVRGLAFLGLGAALLTVSGIEVALWALLALGVVVTHELAARGARTRRESTLILTLFPAAYAVGLWLLVNWLIMGDAAYLLRSLANRPDGAGVMAIDGAAGAKVLALSGAPLLILAVVAVVRLSKGGALIAVLGLAALAPAAAMAAVNCLWDTTSILVALVPLGTLGAGWLVREWSTRWRAAAMLAALLPLAPAAWVWAHASAGAPVAAYGPVRDPSIGSTPPLAQIARRVLSETRYPRVFVCGYGSFSALGESDGPVFVHALDFDFVQARRDYYGHRLYLLVQRPAGRVGRESVYWKYPRLFAEGAASTLHHSDWGEWRLFEIIEGRSLGPAGMDVQ